MGYIGVCCTDHEALSAHVKFIKRFKEINKLKQKYNKLKLEGKEKEIEEDKDIQKNIQYILNISDNFKIGLGNEIYLIDDLENINKFYHFILIAKDKKGYEQLKRISSESAWKNWYKQGKMERVPTLKKELEEIIGKEKGHLIAQTACLGSELDSYILEYAESNYKDKEIKQKIHSFIKWGINVFGQENFFLEIQPHKITEEEREKNIIHPQIIVDKFIFNLAKAYNLNIIITTDSHYSKKEDKAIHEAYLKADDDEKAFNRETADFYDNTYLFSKEELIETLSEYLTIDEIKLSFEGSKKVFDMIELFDLEHPVIVPVDKKIPNFKLRHIFKDYYNKYEYINKYAKSENQQDQYLLYLIENGFDKFKEWKDSEYEFVTYGYNGEIIEQHKKIVTFEEKIARINEELSSFWQISEKINQKLSSYYTLVRGLVHEVMWKISYVGPGRGSAGGSYVCYLIEITQINPLKFDLPFWRHSSPLRPELPDLKF